MPHLTLTFHRCHRSDNETVKYWGKVIIVRLDFCCLAIRQGAAHQLVTEQAWEQSEPNDLY